MRTFFPSQRRRRLTALLASTVVLAGFVAGASAPASADTAASGFEPPTYATGSIDGQDGWTSTGPYDREVVANTYGYGTFGDQSLRMSNAITSGSFGDQTFSKQVADDAGETSADDDGTSGPRVRHFESQWDFASTVPAAEQPGLSVVASPDRGDGARMSWIQMADAPDGLQVNFYDYQHAVDPTCENDGFVFTTVASGLDRTVPHNINVTMDFVDGAENDIVKVYVDGVLSHTGTSWEDYYRDCELNPTRTVDSVLFRTGGAAAPDTLGYGFVVDNFTVSTSAIETLVVDDDGLAATGDCNANEAATDNIQDAIDGASAGDVVTVCPGTYSEALKIDKDLTLSGVDAPTTVVSVPAGLGVSSCNAGEGRVLVDVCGGAVTIDDLTMSGPGDGSQGCVGSVNYGVFVSNDATLNLVDSVVRDIREPGTGLEGCQTGIGVRAGSRFLGETAHLTMSGSSVTGYQKGGVVVDGPGTDATISGNTIDGGAASPAIARNGVQVGREASATVSGNTIAGNECDLAGVCGPDPIDSSQAAGVLVFEAGSGTVISDNTITTSDMGVYNDTAGSPVSVTGNTITARYEGVYLGDATTNVSHNTITGAATAGVVAVSADWYAGDTNGTVTSNQLLDNGTGISIIDDDTGDALAVNVTAAFNRIVGNGTGVSNSGAATVDAHNNWWGCSLGPAHPGCDDATGTVTTDPRLILRVAASPTSTTSTSTITANLNRNSNGQNVSSLGHIPDGTPVSFSTNNGLLTSTSEVTVNGVATTTLKANGATGPAKVTATVDNQSQIGKVKLAKPNLAIVDYSHAEGDSGTTPFTFIVKLSSASDQTVTVDYATANGTASSANDYVATSGTVTFLPGETQKTITVDVNGDVNVESNETFFVDLSNASTHVVLTDGHAAGKILRDD